jgi:hypothetical protein
MSDRGTEWGEHMRREAAFIAGVKRGLAAAERGEFATDEEVDAVFAKYSRAVWKAHTLRSPAASENDKS